MLVLALALPARAQTTYQTEGPAFGGALDIFSCDVQTTFAGGTVEWLARYGLPGERSLGTFELTTVYSAEGVAYGGAAARRPPPPGDVLPRHLDVRADRGLTPRADGLAIRLAIRSL